MMQTIASIDSNHILFFELVIISVQKTGFDVGGPGASIGIPPE